jgi:hypothetical protein
LRQPEEIKPGMSAELIGIGDEATQIEERHASCLEQKEAVAEKRIRPEIPKDADGQKSTKQQEAFDREVRRPRYRDKSVAAHERYAGLEEQTERKVRMPRSISAESLPLLCRQVEQARVTVKLCLYGKSLWRITVPAHISPLDLTRADSALLHSDMCGSDSHSAGRPSESCSISCSRGPEISD